MKNKCNKIPFIIIAILTFLSVFLIQCSSSRVSGTIDSSSQLDSLLNIREFVFVAESASPMRQKVRHFTSPYDVKLTGDSLISYLPYFGSAYQAPMDPTNIGIQFTSTNFDYNVSAGKNNRWYIAIRPHDASGVQQFNFDIFSNGSATLNVTSTNRDPISFRGRIEKLNQ